MMTALKISYEFAGEVPRRRHQMDMRIYDYLMRIKDFVRAGSHPALA
jgi:hypothetical protein